MIAAEVELSTLQCTRCAMTFAIPQRFMDDRRQDHAAFYCPSGHHNYYGGKSDVEKLKEQLADQERQTKWWSEHSDQVAAGARSREAPNGGGPWHGDEDEAARGRWHMPMLPPLVRERRRAYAKAAPRLRRAAAQSIAEATVTDIVVAAARRVAGEWKAEAEKRRRVSRHDPVADTLDFCAAELAEQLRALDAPGAVRTVEQYAKDHGVTPQAVRNWIHRGELEANRTPHGWRIQRTAVRHRARKTA